MFHFFQCEVFKFSNLGARRRYDSYGTCVKLCLHLFVLSMGVARVGPGYVLGPQYESGKIQASLKQKNRLQYACSTDLSCIAIGNRDTIQDPQS